MLLQQVVMRRLKYFNISKLVLIAGVWLGLNACETSGYERQLKAEYDSKMRNDSLILGFYMGTTGEEFYKHGWEINKQGLVRQGRGNQNISHLLLSADRKSDIEILFYPEFDQQSVIKGMQMRFLYTGWAPWNEHLFSDSLLVAVKDSLSRWYQGNPFQKYTDTEKQVDVWYKIDGNRQITLGISNEKEVKAIVKDLYHPDNDPFN